MPYAFSDQEKQALIILIRNAGTGKVKTRLAKDVGIEKALKIYNYLLHHTRQVSSQLLVKRLLFYDSKISHSDEWDEQAYEKGIQQGDDLGARMLSAFNEAFKKGNEQVIIIGSDCPEINCGIIKSAFEMLKSHDFVLGPAKDGGYYLLGMKYPESQLFINKAWSTNSVAADTLADIESLGKVCFLLPELSDIDTVNDLSPELKKLAGIPS